MICYQCGNTLGAGRLCLRCGADVSIYKKIVRISNSYYNTGLEKARMRDLTGAIEALSKSLQFDKKNIPARNLLGLIYYELGEFVEALCQWVVSKNLQPEDNLANQYLEQVQGDKSGLENMNQAVKKFNLALEYAQNDSEDLAIIQLRGVISQYPKMIKAYQLLALLYIRENDYSKAGRILKHALQIDRGNTYCLKYIREVKGKATRPKAKQASYLEQQIAQQASNEVIVPKYSEKPRVLLMTLGMLLGLAIAVSAYFFLIRPSAQQAENVRWNQTMISYAEKLSGKDAEINSLNSQVETLTSERDAMAAQMEQYIGEDGTLTNYDRLLVAYSHYSKEEWGELVSAFTGINPSAADSEAFMVSYNLLKEFIERDGMLEKIFSSGKALADSYKYDDAIAEFQSCLDYNPDYDPAIYYMGFCYEAKQDEAKAAEYFNDLVNRFPQSEYYSLAKRRVG